MKHTVQLSYLEKHIAVIKLEDRECRNTFSHALVEGLLDAYERIRECTQTKVVVIHGYDNYFCCGGTKEELLKLHAGEIGFAELSFYRILLDLEIPTIAAMQGHALGGGLVFGLYADIIIMAEECFYNTNFMKYGFTPGMGATLIVPEKLGANLANEMLFSAGSYQGGKLRERGVSFKIVKKAEVINTAIDIAREMTDKPLESLKLLKKRMSKKIRQQLPEAIEEESAMHKISFTLPGIRERIEELFGN